MASPELRNSYDFCEALARREAGNFYYAFRVLPTQQRKAMCALYAFMRIADDLSDGPEPFECKQTLLAAYRTQLQDALSGQHDHALFPALVHTLRTYNIPVQYLREVLDGVEMDLTIACYATFEDLYRYCYRVASAVGLCCIHVWG